MRPPYLEKRRQGTLAKISAFCSQKRFTLLDEFVTADRINKWKCDLCGYDEIKRCWTDMRRAVYGCKCRENEEKRQGIIKLGEKYNCELLTKVYIDYYQVFEWKCREHPNEETIKRTLNLIHQFDFICHTCNGSKSTQRLNYDQIRAYARRVSVEIVREVPYESVVKTLIPVRCMNNNCRLESNVSVHQMMVGTGCVPCGRQRAANHHRKSFEDVLAIVESKGGRILEENRVLYVNVRTEYLTNCPNGHQWNATLDKLVRDHWCGRCVPHKFSLDDVRNILSAKGFTLLSDEYFGMKHPLKMICARGHHLDKAFFLVRYARGCMECYDASERGQSTRLDLEHYQEAAALKGYECLEEERPLNTQTPVRWRCDRLHEWEVSYSNFVHNNTYCPECMRIEHQSKLEKQLHDCLKAAGYKFETQKRYIDLVDVKQLSYDVCFSFSIDGVLFITVLIEADGEQHYRPVEFFGGAEQFEVQKRHDRMKDEYCIRNNIALVRIKFDQDVAEALTTGLANVWMYAQKGLTYIQRIRYE